MRQPLLWLLSGLLIGVGFVTAFGGGSFLLLVGVVLAIGLTIKYRYRRRWRGWSALPYGIGASVALFLSPYVFRPSPCVQKPAASCYQGFTVGVFVAAVALALAGLALGVWEVRHWRRARLSS
jgi:hypothetical protein